MNPVATAPAGSNSSGGQFFIPRDSELLNDFRKSWGQRSGGARLAPKTIEGLATIDGRYPNVFNEIKPKSAKKFIFSSR